MEDSPNTKEDWLARFRETGASPEQMRKTLEAFPHGPIADAARAIIGEHEIGAQARRLAISQAEQRPALEQAERHHRIELRAAHIATLVALVSALAAVAAFLAGYLLPNPQQAALERRVFVLEQQLLSGGPSSKAKDKPSSAIQPQSVLPSTSTPPAK